MLVRQLEAGAHPYTGMIILSHPTCTLVLCNFMELICLVNPQKHILWEALTAFHKPRVEQADKEEQE